MLTIIALGVGSIIFALPLLWWYLYLFKLRSLAKIPGPRPTPVIGNANDVGNNPCAFFKNMVKFSKLYDGFFKLFIGPSVRVVIATPELIAPLLSSNSQINKSDSYDLIKPWLGDGLLVSAGNKWRRRRKMITPTFSHQILGSFIKTFNKNSDILLQKLLEEAVETPVDIHSRIREYALDVICETAMGLELKSLSNQNSGFVTAVRKYLNIFIVRSFSSWRRFPVLFKISSDYEAFKSSLKTLHAFSNKVIENKQNSLKRLGTASEPNEDGIKKKVVLLDMLLQRKDIYNLTHEDIREEIDTFIFEGHDTVSSGISFALYSLAVNPEIQRRMYEEIGAVLGSNNEATTMQQLQELTYTDMVMKEVLRLYPSVPMFERQMTEDFEIEGTKFPKGTILTMFIYSMHHSENWFPEPEKFDPNRFLPENVERRNKFAYLPFSAGPRNCIGKKYAMLEMKATIIKILQNFELLAAPGFTPLLGMSAILQSYNGIWVQLKQR